MSRIPPVDDQEARAVFGGDSPFRYRVYAQAPDLVVGHLEWAAKLHDRSSLPARLVELVRLRVAFHNQCRSCMALRYEDLDAGAVCSLEKPYEAPDLSVAEKAALAFADRFATNHLSIDDQVFADTRHHFSDKQVVELLYHLATFVGFGRMAAVLDLTDDLPAAYQDKSRAVAPWSHAPAEP